MSLIEIDNTNQVLALIKQVSNPAKVVVFTNGNSWYIDTLIKNLLKSAEIYEPDCKIAVFCTDSEGAEKCHKLGFQYFAPVIIPKLEVSQLLNQTDSSTNGYTLLTFVKIVLMKFILDAGFIPLYIDPDMAFKRTNTIENILGYLAGDIGLAIAGSPEYLNSNLMVASPRPEIINLFTLTTEDVDSILRDPTLCSDEDFLRPRIHGVKCAYFNGFEYPNGLNASIPIARMLHANCIVGLENKIDLLRRNGGWFIDSHPPIISPEFVVPHLIKYPLFQEGDLFEVYFNKFMITHKPVTKRKYLGATWTNLYCNAMFAGQGYDSAKLQNELDQLPPDDSYFTVVQFDRGVEHHKCPKNTLVFGCCEGDIPIPLIYESSLFDGIVPKSWEHKTIFCSFIGSNTHRVRGKLIGVIRDLPGYYCHVPGRIGDSELQLFIEASTASKFCLAPRGFGRSSFRFFEVLKLGSVPVYIWDDINWLPFQDVIDYSKLCIVINANDMNTLHNTLSKVTKEQYEDMREYYKQIKYLFTFEGVAKQIIARC